MDPQVVALVLGPSGLTIFLVYVVSKLWAAHEREDLARDARVTALDASVDKLADAVRDSNEILIDIRDQRRREVRASK